MQASATATAFGATVDIASGQRDAALFLVVGSDCVPAVVRSHGGRVVTTIGAGRYLSLLTLQASDAVRRDASVRLCGGVTIDPVRFRTFLHAVGLREPP